VEITALTTLAVLSALLAVLIAYERRRFATQRTQMRSELEGEATPD
jgi:cell division protein FtsL